MKATIFILLLLCNFYNTKALKLEISKVDFNSTREDFNSNITQNGKVIYFTSSRILDKQKVFKVERENNSWSSAEEAIGTINESSESGAVSLTSDGQLMLFASFEHNSGGFGRTDIYSSEKVNGAWTNIKNVGANINSDAWDSQPMISNDGNMLFFVSDRAGGFGGTDIYISIKTSSGWSKAVNAGKAINSEFDEMSPVLASDNKMFTFASNRSGGFGNFDIYISKYEGNVFETPMNAGEPINSDEDEFYYYAMPNSNEAYFSSSRGGDLDIYKAVPNPFEAESVFLLNGIVRDANTKEGLGANIIVTDLSTGKVLAELKSDDKSGEYYVVLQKGKTYSITAEKDDYLFYSEKYQVPLNATLNTQVKDISLSSIDGGNTRLLVFFDFDKATLQNESIPELDRIASFLKKNSNIKISLEGHTDDVGNADYNLQLSENRAKAVKEYLIKKNIDFSRIKTLGFGSKNPLINEKTEEARATNRRVEMKIIK